MTASERFVEWAWGLDAAALPADVRTAASRHLLDGLGNALAARRLEAAEPAVTVAREMGGPPQALVIGDTERIGAPAAALANGVLVHALDYDDTHTGALVHATAAVLPTAFAVGEQVDATGAEIVTAAVAGYEVVARLGAAVRHGFHARGFHATSVCGVFASALVAARLLRLAPDDAVSALGIAASQASGSLEFLHTGASTKQLHPGWASMAGIVAARLAAAGASGPASAIEGRHGLYRLYADAEVDAGAVTADLGRRWEVCAVTIKPYPVCQLSHATLDAVQQLRDQVDGAAATRIEVAIPPDSVPIVAEPSDTKVRPRSAYEAKFSVQWCTALMLLDGAVTVDAFGADDLHRTDVPDVARRVEVRTVPYDGPPADAPGEVKIHLPDGTAVEGRVAGSRGTPDAPLSDDELRAKFAANCGTDARHVADLADRVLHLWDVSSVRDLLATLSNVRDSVEVP